MVKEPENLVLELLRGIRADITDVKSRMATKAELAELRAELKADMNSLRADVASDLLAMQAKNEAEHKATREQIAGLNRSVFEYHSSVIGHGMPISELEARVRRVEQHLTFRRSTPIEADAFALALAAARVQIDPGRLAKDVPLANRVRSGRKQP